MPTFSLQCGPNADPNIRKVRNADPMPTLRTFLAALLLIDQRKPNITKNKCKLISFKLLTGISVREWPG